ncbi:TPA: hypothetical protein RQL13_001004 [Vibrio vulnificus]|nr:hypothetical protein [Vibrio vulnificus]HAS6249397.1 hypothetical protein [Vibrio vulnificus]HDY8198695.1 hypothetical protein [Vibrio vulnificus]
MALVSFSELESDAGQFPVESATLGLSQLKSSNRWQSNAPKSLDNSHSAIIHRPIFCLCMRTTCQSPLAHRGFAL